MRAIWIKIALFACIVFAVPAGCVWMTKPTMGHCDHPRDAPIDGLPQSATDITYNIRGLFGPVTAYSFHVNQRAFDAWVIEQREQFEHLPQLTEGETYFRCYDWAKQNWDDIHITRASYAKWAPAGDDNSVQVAYDLDTSMAYFYHSTR